MSEEMQSAHAVSDANDHAIQKGDGSRAALPAMPAPKRGWSRRIKVTQRQAFLPEHHQHASHGLQPLHKPKGHSK